MTPEQDEELLEEFRHGDHAALEKLVRRYQRPLYFLCFRMTSNHEDAVESVQKTFVSMCEKLATLQKPSAFRTWLYKIAVNLCRNARREKMAYSRALSSLGARMESFCAGDPLEREEQTNFVRCSLQELSEKQKTAVILRVYHNLSYQEIGDILGCREVTARSHFHLGLKNLAVKLKDLWMG